MQTTGNNFSPFCDDPKFKHDFISGNDYCIHCWIKKADHYIMVVFAGWQDLPIDFTSRGIRPFKLYNIIGGLRHGTTVGTVTLKQMGLKVPKAPTLKQWRKSHV